MHDSKSLASATLNALNKNNLSEFGKLIESNSVSDLNNINPQKIHNTGRYKLIASSHIKKTDSSYVGQIFIHKPFISQDKAIIFFSVASSPRAARTNAFLLKKVDAQWVIVENIEVRRW